MIKNKKWWLILIATVIVIGIAGKMHMDQRKKDLQELHQIQKDLANYIYRNFVIYTNDEEKFEEIRRQNNENKGMWTTIEYLDKLKEAQVYYDIDKIEFTNISVSPTRSLRIQFQVNDVYYDYTLLNTKSYETGKWIYDIGSYHGDGPYYLEEKKQMTYEPFPDNKIIYYEGGINNGPK